MVTTPSHRSRAASMMRRRYLCAYSLWNLFRFHRIDARRQTNAYGSRVVCISCFFSFPPPTTRRRVRVPLCRPMVCVLRVLLLIFAARPREQQHRWPRRRAPPPPHKWSVRVCGRLISKHETNILVLHQCRRRGLDLLFGYFHLRLIIRKLSVIINYRYHYCRTVVGCVCVRHNEWTSGVDGRKYGKW